MVRIQNVLRAAAEAGVGGHRRFAVGEPSARELASVPRHPETIQKVAAAPLANNIDDHMIDMGDEARRLVLELESGGAELH